MRVSLYGDEKDPIVVMQKEDGWLTYKSGYYLGQNLSKDFVEHKTRSDAQDDALSRGRVGDKPIGKYLDLILPYSLPKAELRRLTLMEKMLKAALEQLKEYSDNEIVEGKGYSYPIELAEEVLRIAR